MQGLGFGVWGLGFRISRCAATCNIEVYVLCFMVEGLGLRLPDSKILDPNLTGKNSVPFHQPHPTPPTLNSFAKRILQPLTRIVSTLIP
jgi:hypothetical protein